MFSIGAVLTAALLSQSFQSQASAQPLVVQMGGNEPVTGRAPKATSTPTRTSTPTSTRTPTSTVGVPPTSTPTPNASPTATSVVVSAQSIDSNSIVFDSDRTGNFEIFSM